MHAQLVQWRLKGHCHQILCELSVPLWPDFEQDHHADLSSFHPHLGLGWGSSRCQIVSSGRVRSRNSATCRGRWWQCDRLRCRPHPCGEWTGWWCGLKSERERDKERIEKPNHRFHLIEHNYLHSRVWLQWLKGFVCVCVFVCLTVCVCVADSVPEAEN